MKKILFILPYLHMGGAETQFRNLIVGLKKKYSITVYVLNKFDKQDEFIINNPEIKVEKIGFYFKENYKNIILKLLSYIFNYFFISTKLFYKYIFLNEKYEFTITYQEILTPLIPILKLISDKVIFSIRSASKKLLKRKYLSFLLNMCDVIVSNSYEAKIYLEKINVKNIEVILNGISEDKKYIHEFKIPQNFRNIFVIARVHPTKNQMLILEAFKDIEININFLGKVTDETYKKKLVEFIKKNNIEERIKFLDYTKNMKEIWNKIDLLILPSFEEGVANVILESYFNGKLIILSNINENKFLMKKENRLFDPKNSEELRDKYLNLLKEDKGELLDELNENLLFLEKKFALKVMLENYENLLKGEL